LQESFAGWVHQSADEARVLVNLDYVKKEDRFHGNAKSPGDGFAAALLWRQNGGEEPKFVADLANKKGGQSAVRGPWADNPRGWTVLGYGPFRRASGEAAPAARLMSGPPRVAALVSLFREDASLLESLEWLKDVHTRSLEGNERASATKRFVLSLLDDGLMPEGVRVLDFKADGLIVEQHGVKLTLRDLSDGYRTVATLALDILRHFDRSEPGLHMRDDGPLHRAPPLVQNHAVVLIDEIDAHLHISWQRRVGRWMTDHFPNVQFIVTTHSPFICQSASDRGIIRLSSPGEPTRDAEHVSPELFRRVVNGSIDDAIVTELFGLDSPYSIESQSKRAVLAELESRAIHGGISAAERRRLKSLQLELAFSVPDQVASALRELRAQIQDDN
jgi:hypothetical protein